jgi:hypothetical protein
MKGFQTTGEASQREHPALYFVFLWIIFPGSGYTDQIQSESETD